MIEVGRIKEVQGFTVSDSDGDGTRDAIKKQTERSSSERYQQKIKPDQKARTHEKPTLRRDIGCSVSTFR